MALSPGGGVFSGVRFVLFGFDSASEEQYRSEIAQRGGVDLGEYHPSCTHAIVCARVYDDPFCVMARNDGKIVVTEAWVDDTLDLGVRADETKVLYRPVRDLDGIPGSKSLHICLTGYQRQEREDIMRMVTMMGARFSKPLIANQITHLICYKFEGEKYELAKRVNIKLVNHRWLEDCLKAWAILPIDDYNKSGWELEMMEAEARDSEEETDNEMAKRKSLDQTANKETSSLHNEPSSSGTRNTHTESPAPRKTSNPQSTGQNQIPATIHSKDVGSKRIVDLSINAHLLRGPTTLVTPNLPTKAAEPGPVDKSSSSSSIQAATSGTDMELEKTRLALKSSSLHSRPTPSAGPVPVTSHAVMLSSSLDSRPTPAGPVPITSHAVMPLSSLETGGVTKNPDFTTPEVNLSIEGPLLHCSPASSIAPNPLVKSPAPEPFNNQGARDHLVIMPHEESVLKKMKLHVKSPPSTGNHTLTAALGLLSQNSDLQEKSVTPNLSKDRESLDKMAQIDSRSKEKVNLPIKKSPSVISNHKLDASTRQLQDADFRREDYLVKTPAEVMKSGEEKGLTKVGQSKVEDDLCINPQNETKVGQSSAMLSLSENKEIASSELGSCTNVVITCNSTTSPQIGTRSKRDLCVPSDAPLETLKCQNVSSGGKHGLSGVGPVLTTSATTKKSYTRKLRKNSASPEEQQSDPSVNSTTPKVVLSISPPGLGDRNGDVNGVVDIEKSAEQSRFSVPRKRKTSKDLSHISPSVSNKFEELEHVNSLSKERDAFADEQGQHEVSTATDDTSKPVSKTSRIKRTSVKCTKPPRYSPLNPNNVVSSEAADKVRVEEKSELVTDKQSNVLNFSSYFGSPTEKLGTSTPTFVAQDRDNEMRHALNQSRKAETVDKILEIKGLSPDSIEAELNKHPWDTSSGLCDYPKHSVCGRIKKAVAKRSIKARLQNLSVNNDIKVGDNSGAKPGSANNSMYHGTKDEGEASDARPRDDDSGFLREERNDLSVNLEIAKALESGVREKAESIDVRPKTVKTKISRKLGTKKGASSGTNSESSIQEGLKSTSNKSNVSMDWLLTSIELDSEKENRPDPGEPSSADFKSVLRCKKKEVPSQKECTGSKDHNMVLASMGPPTCFILSGHRLQRKEFQAVIKKLKGRVCRDTHSWSFQATHFIVPGPVRRTEKFFAAAASGRWILKMEYLTASNEAGRFIEEEPYEWFGSGMTEDSSISLEAPRKWRLVREQTGHGAFFGMQIVIYGECIAPSLDTMKRAIKAGDGTILATSPPYTRILKSNCIDFAVVPAAIPSSDPWVREFLNHQIPCVTSDYLVEYVCKPGYSLSKHVLFQTQEWADKSLQKLIKSCQEVCESNSPLKLRNGSDRQDELRCAVCGLHDRGEVMLVCGDEAGSAGCGIGTHIDCCDPPLETVPDDDWFCCKCSKIKSKKSSLTRKGHKRSKKC